MITTKTAIEQVAEEMRELESVEKIPVAQFQPKTGHGESGRCGWCGQWADDLVAVHDYGPPGADGSAPGVITAQRYKGVKCCGGRHL